MKGFLNRLRPKKQEQGTSESASEESSSTPEADSKGAETLPGAQKPQEGGAASQKIVLELGDLLSRIPAHLLKEGAHDPGQRIFFKMSDLHSNLSEGKATIPLSSIASRCPEIFRKEITPEEDVEIFFPWSKLLERVRNYKAMMQEQPQGDKNPHYKTQGPATPAIKFRQQPAPQAPLVPRQPVENPAPSEAPAPAAEKTESIPAPAEPASAAGSPSASTAPMSPLASRRLKQNWFNAAAPAPSLTQLPVTQPQEKPAPAEPAAKIERPSLIPGPTVPAKQATLGTLSPPPAQPAVPSKPLSLAAEPPPAAPALSLSLEKPATPAVPVEAEKPAPEPAQASAKPPAQTDKNVEALSRECASLFEEKGRLAAEFAKAKEIHQKLVEKLTGDREAAADENNKTLLQLAETRTDYEKKIQELREDFAKQTAALKAQGASAQQQAADKALADTVKQKDDQLAKTASELEAHKKQLESLGSEKLRIERELVQSKEKHLKEIEAAVEARDVIWVEKDEIAGKLHKASKEHEKALQSLREDFTKQTAAIKEQHEKALAEKESLLSRHGAAADQQRNALMKQKEEALAKLTSDLEGHKKQVETLGRERTEAVKASEKHAAELKEATSKHHVALQVAREDFSKQMVALKEEQKRIVAEKESLLSKHGAAAERERNNLIKQKDDQLLKLAAEIESHKKQLGELAAKHTEADAAKKKFAGELEQARAEHEKKIKSLQEDFAKRSEAAVQERNNLVKQKDGQLQKFATEIESHKKQIGELGGKHAGADAAKNKLAGELTQAKAEHENKIKLLQEDFAKRSEAAGQERNNLVKQKDEQLQKLAGEIEAHKKQIGELGAKHAEAEAAKNKLAGELGQRDNLARQKDEQLQRLAAEIEAHKKQVGELGGRHADTDAAKNKLAGELAQAKEEHENKIKSLQEDFARQTATLKEEHARSIAEKETLLSKHGEAAEQERNNLIKQKDEQLHKLAGEIEAHKKQIAELGGKHAETEAARSKLAGEFEQAKAEHQKKIKSLQEDFAMQATAASEMHGRSIAEKESLLSKKLQAGEQERANLLQQKDAAIAKLTADIESHRKQIEALNKERDSHRDSRTKAEADLQTTKDQQRRQIENLTKERDSLVKEKEVISSKLSDAVRSHH